MGAATRRMADLPMDRPAHLPGGRSRSSVWRRADGRPCCRGVPLHGRVPARDVTPVGALPSGGHAQGSRARRHRRHRRHRPRDRGRRLQSAGVVHGLPGDRWRGRVRIGFRVGVAWRLGFAVRAIAPDIAYAIHQREQFGLRADLEWVLAVAADPRGEDAAAGLPDAPRGRGRALGAPGGLRRRDRGRQGLREHPRGRLRRRLHRPAPAHGGRAVDRRCRRAPARDPRSASAGSVRWRCVPSASPRPS